jgi:hypothetical protein
MIAASLAKMFLRGEGNAMNEMIDLSDAFTLNECTKFVCLFFEIRGTRLCHFYKWSLALPMLDFEQILLISNSV